MKGKPSTEEAPLMMVVSDFNEEEPKAEGFLDCAVEFLSAVSVLIE